MARLARIVVPGVAHHVTQRGSRRQHEPHLYNAARYVELNPVRANLVETGADWAWSSAAAHLRGEDDRLVKVAPLLERWPDWQSLLDESPQDLEVARMRKHARTGRPLGDAAFVQRLERAAGRELTPRPAGRPRSQAARSPDAA